jgi:hypothetical protein
MIKLTVNGKVIEAENGITPLELLEPSQAKNYYVCKVNNRLRELTYPLNYDATVEFLGLSHSEACKTYEASLRYLVSGPGRKPILIYCN